jgi:3-hydroxyisobutyrate dehydrogenase
MDDSLVGYIGLGSMGGALARRVQLQYPLHVYDQNPVALRKMVEHGANACGSINELASKCLTIFLCLPTSEHVRTVIFGEGGIASSAKPGTLIIDQTTGDPVATREMAAELEARGLQLMDAPVSGGARGADAGTIAIMIGATPAQYDRVEPLLRVISPNLFHAGGTGTGHVAKLANNLLSGGQRLLSLEAMALAVKNGLQPEKAIEIILASGGRNLYMEKFMPNIVKGKLASGFTLGLLHKDVRLACQLGDDSGVVMHFGNLAKEYYQMAVNEMGPDVQVNSVALIMDRQAGTHVVPADYSGD